MENYSMSIIFLLTLLFVCHSEVNSEPTHWKIPNMKQHWPLNLIHKKESSPHASDSYVPVQIVQVSPKYPVWKIHKYSGIQLKPVSSIPALKVETINEQHKKTPKHNLPPIEEIQNILGTSSMIETVETLKELAATDDGRRMMANYIKTYFPGLEISESEIVSAIHQYQTDVLKNTNVHPSHENTIPETFVQITNINHPKENSYSNRLPQKKPESPITSYPKTKFDASIPYVVYLKENNQFNKNGQSFLWIPKSSPYYHQSNIPVLQPNNIVFNKPPTPVPTITKIPDLKSYHHNFISGENSGIHTKESNFPFITINSAPIVVSEDIKVQDPFKIGVSPQPYFGPESQKLEPIQEIKMTARPNGNGQNLFQTNLNRETTEHINQNISPVSNLESKDNSHYEINGMKEANEENKEYYQNRPVIAIKYEFPNFSYTQLSEVSKMSDAVKPFEEKYITGNREETVKNNPSGIPTTISVPKEDYSKQFSSQASPHSGIDSDSPKKYDVHQRNSSITVNNIPSEFPISVSPNGFPVNFQQFENNVISTLLKNSDPQEVIKLAISNSENQLPYNKKPQQYNHAAIVPTQDPNNYMFALENTIVNNAKSEEVKVTHDTIVNNGRPVNSLHYDFPNLSYTQLSEIPLTEYDYPNKETSSYEVPISGYQSQVNELLPAASENIKTETYKNDHGSLSSTTAGSTRIAHDESEKTNVKQILKTKENLSGTTVIYAISPNSTADE